ncbi:glyoxalase [Paenibacillus sp. WLX1005]|uniref:glyoxalase n=1 Tax=Paenibacillus sp. WLX1005 TaxID=3243766 RepID=UPI0039843400
MFRIQHLILYTAAIKPMHDFYVQVFGKDIVQLQSSGFTIQFGTSRLEFKEVTNGTKPFYHFAINIAANHLEQAKAWIAKTTPLSTEEGQDDTHSEFFNSYSCYFEDPAGNIVECIARQQHAPTDLNDFTPASIQSIGEINITTPSVLATANLLHKANMPIQLELIDEQRLNFVGSMDAYLLLGPVGRRWFFSHQLSEIHPLTIQFDHSLQLDLDDEGKLECTYLPS